jgi:hypothetical protein
MDEPPEVESFISPENQAWISSLLLPEFDPECYTNASRYLYDLVLYLFPNDSPEVTFVSKPRERLRVVRDIMRIHFIPGDYHFSAILSLSDPRVNPEEGSEQLNRALSGIREFLTPTEEFLDQLRGELDERRLRCEEQLQRIQATVEQNKEYQSRLHKIEKCIRDAHDTPDKRMAMKLLGEATKQEEGRDKPIRFSE